MTSGAAAAAPGSLALRPAEAADADRLLAWRNDPASVAASPTGIVAPAEHRDWFAGALLDPHRLIWIAEDDGRPVGMVRIDVADTGAGTVSIVLAPEARGRRLATRVLEAAAAAGRRRGVRALRAVIMPGNEASLRAFRAAGYRERARDDRSVVLVRDLREAT